MNDLLFSYNRIGHEGELKFHFSNHESKENQEKRGKYNVKNKNIENSISDSLEYILAQYTLYFEFNIETTRTATDLKKVSFLARGLEEAGIGLKSGLLTAGINTGRKICM